MLVNSTKILRVSAGLSLLLFLATEEKVCPWLFAATDELRPEKSPNAESSDPSNDDPSEPPPSPPLMLGELLPDALLPRWSRADGAITRPQSVALRAAVAAGQPDPTEGNQATAPTPKSHAIWCDENQSARPANLEPMVCALIRSDLQRQSIDSCIQRTGPPVF